MIMVYEIMENSVIAWLCGCAIVCAVHVNISEIGLSYSDSDLVDVASEDDGVTSATIQQCREADNGHVQVHLCVM